MTAYKFCTQLARIVIIAMISGCASPSTNAEILETALPQATTPAVEETATTPIYPIETTAQESHPTQVGTEPPTLTLSDPLERKLVILARQNLAERLGITEDQIQLTGIQEMTWPDASLGCPEPNTVYAQVKTPGYRIILVAESDVYKGEVYQYHTDMEGEIKFCNPVIIPLERTPYPWRSEPGN